MEPQNQKAVNILIVPDKFKGSLSSKRVSNAIKQGICSVLNKKGSYLKATFNTIEIADGGDGSLCITQKILKKEKYPCLKKRHCKALNAALEEVRVPYLTYENHHKEKCAFIEMASICGIAMLDKQKHNPLYTSSYGLGQVIKKVIKAGAKQITLAIGGSATNDCGAGMLSALGYEFLDKNNKPLSKTICGKHLQQITRILPPDNFPKDITFKVICDVTNPLLGKNGATYIYGPQKGGSKEDLDILEKGMRKFSTVASKSLNICEQIKNFAGSGAAGGVGYASQAFLNAGFVKGWDFFSTLTNLQEYVKHSDIVITGEGKLDKQSLNGKIISGVLELAKKHGCKTAIFCGSLSVDKKDFLKDTLCYQICSIEKSFEKCISNAYRLLYKLSAQYAKDTFNNYLGS